MTIQEFYLLIVIYEEFLDKNEYYKAGFFDSYSSVILSDYILNSELNRNELIQ